MPPVRLLSRSGHLSNFLVPLMAQKCTSQTRLCRTDLSIFLGPGGTSANCIISGKDLGKSNAILNEPWKNRMWKGWSSTSFGRTQVRGPGCHGSVSALEGAGREGHSFLLCTALI